MHEAEVTPSGARMRWIDMPAVKDGTTRNRVWLHGLGAASGPYFAAISQHALLRGPRSLLFDFLGFGISERPDDFGYTLEEHADTLARAVKAAGVKEPADVIAHSMGGAISVVFASRHPDLVARLVLIDANLDPVAPQRDKLGSAGIAAQTEKEFVEGGWKSTREISGPFWWATMRLAGRVALYRSAVHLAKASVPTMRELLMKMEIPRTFLRPEANGPGKDEKGLIASGVNVVPIPDCGHNIMLDNPDAFARATAAALPDPAA